MGYELKINDWKMVASDGLPLDGTWCFLIVKDKDGAISWELGGYNKERHEFYLNFGLGGLITIEENVIAWAPLDCAKLTQPSLPKPKTTIEFLIK